MDRSRALTKYDYDFLNGTWEGVQGAAYNECYEWCRNQGYGGVNDPTEAGRKAMQVFRMEHSL